MPCAPKQGNWISSHPRLSTPNRSAYKAFHFSASCGTAVLQVRSLVPDRDAHKRVCFRVCVYLGFPRWLSGKESACNAGDEGLIPGLGRSRRRTWQPTSVFLPGQHHGQSSQEGYMGSHKVGQDSVTEHVCVFRGIHLDSFAIKNGIYFLIHFRKLCYAFQNQKKQRYYLEGTSLSINSYSHWVSRGGVWLWRWEGPSKCLGGSLQVSRACVGGLVLLETQCTQERKLARGHQGASYCQ